MAEQETRPMDQAQTLRSLNRKDPVQPPPVPTRVFSVTSGKGGVGKTAVVANIALLLARKGKQVLILDADLGLANIDVVFGLAPGKNLNHFFSGGCELDSLLVEGPEGIHILPAGSGVQQFTHLTAEQKMRLLEGLDTLHTDYDFVLIDTEAGISENVTYFNTAAQEILMVTTPEPTAITDAYALMKLLSTKYHKKHFNLVVNFIKDEEEALDVYRKLTMVANHYLDISIDYLGSIARDPRMIKAIRKQQILVQLYPDSRTAQMFATLTTHLIEDLPPVESRGTLQFFWKRLLDFS